MNSECVAPFEWKAEAQKPARELIFDKTRPLNGTCAFRTRRLINLGASAAYKCVVFLLGKVHGRREELRSFAQERGVSFTGEVYFRPVHRMPAYESGEAVHLPITEDLCENHVCPPLYPELSDEDVDYVCDVMNAFLYGVSADSEPLLKKPKMHLP
eukprot:s472_g17.t6